VSATAVWGAKEALVKAIGGRTPNFAWSAIDVAPCGPSCGAAWHHRLAEALPSGPEAGHATASFDGYPLADVAWSAVDGRVFTVVTVPSDRG
jgi:hypothetical protein